MSFHARRSTLFAGLALAGLLALPAAADSGRRVPLQINEDGGSCRVDDGAAAAAPQKPAFTAEQLAEIKARMAAAIAADGASGGVIPLNGRGYNYRRADDPTRELLLIQRELESR